MNKKNAVIALLIVFFVVSGLALLIATPKSGRVFGSDQNLVACETITNEDQCYGQNNCEGIYAPSCSECQDLIFQHCQQISGKTLDTLQNEINLCKKTGGKWYRNKLGNFCLCQEGKKDYFDKKLGCIEK